MRKKNKKQPDNAAMNYEELKGILTCVAFAVRDMAAALDYAEIFNKSTTSGYAARINGIVTHMNHVLNKTGDCEYSIPDNRQRDKEPFIVRGLPF